MLEKIQEEERLSEKRIKLKWEKNPRSMLCEINSPIPLPKSINNFSDGTFINRVSELNTAWEIFIYNWENRNNKQKKFKLLVTGQMFGSGKTTFGENILNFNDTHIAKEFLKIPESSGKDALRRAIYLKIDFQNIYILPQIVDIKQVISLNIWINLFKNYFGIALSESVFFWSQKNYNLLECIGFISEICQRPIFIHFDELNYLETPSYFKQLYPEFYKSRTEKDLFLVYYEFWDAIYPLFEEGIFVYCTGKSMKLLELGKNRLGTNLSPCHTEHLYLSAFTVKDVKDAICSDKQILSSINISEINDVAEWLHDLTSGVPRLVFYGIDAINQIFKNDTNITLLKIDSNEDDISNYIRKAPGASPNLSELNKISKEIIPALLLAYQSNLLFSPNEKIFGISDFTVQDLIEKFGFFVSAVSSNALRVLIPKIWMSSIVELGLPEIILTSSFNSAYVDKGKALEVVTERVILIRSIIRSKKTKISDVLPFLREMRTFLNKSLIGKMMKIDCNLTINTQTTYDELKSFLITNKNNDILLKFKEKSSSMDLCIRLAYDEGLPVSLIAIQCKNVLVGFSIADLKNEIKKVLKFIFSDKNGGDIQNYKCLFVLSLTGSGTKNIELLRGKVIESTSGINMEYELEIPDNMQVVVLSKKQMQEFLGQENLRALEKLKV